MLTQLKMLNKNTLSAAIAMALLVSACGESSSSSSGEEYGDKTPIETGFDEGALITNLVDNVVTPTFESFVIKSTEQASLVDGYCLQEQAFADGLATQTDVDNAKGEAKLGWNSAMETWQQAEIMAMGPLLDNDSLLKNNIYSWPVVNSCAVDYDVVFFKGGVVNGAPYDITKRTSSRKGLAALEYLLFNDDLADSCETGSPEDWNNQSEGYRKVARCEFATEVALDIVNSANSLVTQWTAADGYAAMLKQAGNEGSEFATQHDAVNRISDAMFYLDSKTKDVKLAEPLGLFINECGSAPCPEEVESKYASQSITHILNNLLAFNRLLSGDDGSGFVDFLIDSNAQDIADTMSSDVQLALSDVQAYQQSLAITLAENPEQVFQTHAEIKKVTDQLKTDFINSLALELPQTSAGDND